MIPFRTHSIRIALLFCSVIASMFILSCCGKDDPPPPVINGDATTVVSTSGDILKGDMGQGVAIQFAVRDDGGHNLPNEQIQLTLMDGDGSLSATSGTTDSTGIAEVTYTFDGARGDAIVRAILTGKDTVMVMLRANTLITGPDGQAQYILLSDRFSDILEIDGTPASIDIFPNVSGQEHTAYMNYEAAHGFVPVIYRETNENTPRDTAHILALIVNTIYDGKTSDSIGIGSSFHDDIRPAWGTPDTLFTDPDFTTDFIVWYASRGMELHANRSDSVVFEIHLVPPAIVKSGQSQQMWRQIPVLKRLRAY